MAGEAIPAFNHVARYCGFIHLTEGGRVSGTAFRLRPPKDGAPPEVALSVNWLERLHESDRATQLSILREHLPKQGITVRSKGSIAVLRAGKTIEWVTMMSPDRRVLRITSEPLAESPSHSEIHGYTHEEVLVADLIAETVLEQHPARG